MRYLIFIVIALNYTLVKAQLKVIPGWFVNAFNQQKLNSYYELKSYIKPGFLEADFNGDGIKDIAALVIEKRTHKKGIILIYAKSLNHFVFGAGTMVGKKGFDDSDNLKWVDGWSIYKDKIAYETKFNNGDIEGEIKRRLPNKGISIWANQDGAPLAGGIIYLDGKRFAWIHQGE